jgi:trimethylamine--corrinoid protein Co-methyltransferase
MDDNALGRGAYDDVEPAGHFLGSSHTMANYETAYYDAVLSDSESCESWEERGSKDTAERAYERWNALLEAYEPPPMDPTICEALEEFVAKRKAELPNAWY